MQGTSFIAWGGRDLAQNAHAATRDQRFALDILMLAPDTRPSESLFEDFISGKIKSHSDDGSQNAHYFCFGRVIAAPGKGVVADARDGIADNTPGTLNTRDIPGNYVVIDHGNNEYSMLAHLKFASVSVKKGDRVRAGDPIGRCGNSGHSSEPHLHYHMQNTPRWLDGEGLPAQFHAYRANAETVMRGEPIQGQLITNAATDVTPSISGPPTAKTDK